MSDFWACAQAMHKPGQKQNSASHVVAQMRNSANFPCKPKVCCSGGLEQFACLSDYTDVLERLASTHFCL